MAAGDNSNLKRAAALFVVLLAASRDAQADFRFGAARNLGPGVNSMSSDGSPNISADGQTLYFDSIRAGGTGNWDIWATTRTTEGDWGAPEPLPWPVNSVYADAGASISTDGLSLYFASDRAGGYGSFDLWVVTRKTRNDPWGAPTNLGSRINTFLYENHPSLSADGLSLYFDSSQPWGADYDIWVSTRKTTSSAWGEPVNLGPLVNSSGIELSPAIHAGDLVLFFDSRFTDRDIWMVRRDSASEPWGLRVNVGSPVNADGFDTDPSVSADGTTLYFGSDRTGGVGGQDLWEVPIEPVVDLNGDGVVDLRDFALLGAAWGQSDRLADAGPTPLGDGTVDLRDVAVLAQSWLADSRFSAWWRLDEETGSVAHDSSSGHDGILQGDPVWRPQGGKAGGALEFDGVDDCVVTDEIEAAATGPFTVFAWIKGGAPGQVILSQVGWANWLLAGSADGGLATDLKQTGRNGRSLTSSAVVTDGAWHRVGLIWDGVNRRLYVDGLEVAADTQASLERQVSGFCLGAGGKRAADASWSGLIDDVRFYDNVVRP